jgi:hypothetical protein
MSEAQSSMIQGPIEERRRLSEPGEGRPRAVGSPLPVGSGTSPAAAHVSVPQQVPVDKQRSLEAAANAAPRPAAAATPSSSPAPSLSSPVKPPSSGPSGMQRAMSALRATLPLVQRILPLLDGNIGTTVSNILAPQHRAPAPTPPPVNLTPIKESLAALETRHRELSDQLVEQNSSLKRVEDQLGMVREATDRNTLEQQELLEDLKGVGHKVNLFAFFALGLLLVSVVINVVLLLHIERGLP